MIQDLEKFNTDWNPQKIIDTTIYKYLEQKGNTFFCEQFKFIERDITNILSRIPAMFSNYTNHDITHSYRVADYMVSLLPDTLNTYDDIELAIMLEAAIFHDVGMCISETENDIDISKQEEIRKTHHVRSYNYVMEKAKKEYFKIDNYSDIYFTKLIALLVQSHGEDYDWIKSHLRHEEILGSQKCNPTFISVLLRLGDYLDFDARRTPLALFTNLNLSDLSSLEWRKHFCITNFPKINEQRQIYFYGNCEEPEIYYHVQQYIRAIENEIEKAKNILIDKEKKYCFDVQDNILNQIAHEKFTTVDLKYEMDYTIISSLLMGENLYSDKKIVLRELIQNSIDACLLNKEITTNKLYIPVIKIKIDNEKITIQDNGIGMSIQTIEKYFLCVGKSFYTSDTFKKLSTIYKPISHYGIGFLSTFLLTEKIDIETISIENKSVKYLFDVKKYVRDVIIKKEEIAESKETGTIISFKNKYYTEYFNSIESVIDYIQSLFIEIPIDIEFYDKSKLVKSLKYQSILSSNKIDLSSYLDGITCVCDTPKTNFNLFNISNPFFNKDNYIYDPYHLTSEILDKEDFDILMNNTKDIYDISYLLSKNKLRVLTIYPLDSDAEEYYDNVLNRENDTLLAFENTISECFVDEITICYSIDEIQNFEKHSIHTFHENHISTNQKDFLEELKKLFRKQNIDADSFLIDFSEKKIFKTDSFYSLIKNNFRKYNSLLGIKNIRIPSFSLTLPVELNNAKTNNWIINITKDGIFPNIARDSINDKVSSDISEAIGYSFYMYLYDKETDNYKKDFLLSFIQTAYSSKNNSFMKLKY